MSYLIWIFVGFASGFLTSKFVNESGKGVFLDTALGIAGAVIAGLLFTTLEMSAGRASNLWGLAASVLGAISLLVAYRIVFHRLGRAAR
jgi:uncharacterized membrane protein YeaQ/YmgE (transglycosylase-associated protein family)